MKKKPVKFLPKIVLLKCIQLSDQTKGKIVMKESAKKGQKSKTHHSWLQLSMNIFAFKKALYLNEMLCDCVLILVSLWPFHLFLGIATFHFPMDHIPWHLSNTAQHLWCVLKPLINRKLLTSATLWPFSQALPYSRTLVKTFVIFTVSR